MLNGVKISYHAKLWQVSPSPISMLALMYSEGGVDAEVDAV